MVWVVAGLLALAGALTYAELTTMRPHAGAEYVITKDAYGRVWGFLEWLVANFWFRAPHQPQLWLSASRSS